METKCKCGGNYEEFFFGVIPGVSTCQECGEQAPFIKGNPNHDLALKIKSYDVNDKALWSAVIQ